MGKGKNVQNRSHAIITLNADPAKATIGSGDKEKPPKLVEVRTVANNTKNVQVKDPNGRNGVRDTPVPVKVTATAQKKSKGQIRVFNRADAQNKGPAPVKAPKSRKIQLTAVTVGDVKDISPSMLKSSLATDHTAKLSPKRKSKHAEFVTNQAGELSQGDLNQIHLRESIALICLLNDNPREPEDNQLSNFVEDATAKRSMSLPREKEIVETLAFLTAIDDNPRKVAALCVEEDLAQKSLSIKLAANHGGLQRVKEGLESVCRILETVASQSKPSVSRVVLEQLETFLLATADTEPDYQEAEDALVRSSVMMNQNRVLCRLRSCHSNSKSNFKKLKAQRVKPVKLLNDEFLRQATLGNLNEIKSDIDILQSLFLRLESMSRDVARSGPGLEILISIVKTVHGLLRHVGFDEFLSNSLRSDPDAIRGLQHILQQLARYVKASSNLLLAARRHVVFTHISIEIVKLSIPRPLRYDSPENIVDRLMDRFPEVAGQKQLASKLQSSVLRRAVYNSAEFDLLSLMTAECAVHAEIQLLFHYEVAQPKSYPRVICSTKKACFLCNLFFSLHGRFFIPSTHGRVYEKWAIPEPVLGISIERAETLALLMTRFIEALDDQIRDLLGARVRRFPSAKESTVFHSIVWSATDVSTGDLDHPDAFRPEMVSVAEDPISPLEEHEKHYNSSVLTSRSSISMATNMLQCCGKTSSSREGIETESTESTVHLPPILMNDCNTNTLIVTSDQHSSYRLMPGQSVQVEFHGLSQSMRIKADRIHLTLTPETLTSDISLPTTPPQNYVAFVKYLDSKEFSGISEKASNVLDIDLLTGGSELVFDQYLDRVTQGVYMYKGADMVFIRFWKSSGST